jgi:hypothetical protein
MIFSRNRATRTRRDAPFSAADASRFTLRQLQSAVRGVCQRLA